jgi:thymidylate synthase ThyX
MTIEAEIVCDSVNKYNNRLTTFRLKFPKFVLAELNTHRVISKSTSSSRAVTTAKYIEEVRNPDLRVNPSGWGKNIPGMQAKEELTGEALAAAKKSWALAANDAAFRAEHMLNQGVHKQLVNRVLEPFVHARTVTTATEYMNFFGLRLDKDAQPEIRELAEKMWRAYVSSHPRSLRKGQWHLPFVTTEDEQKVISYTDKIHKGSISSWVDLVKETYIKISVARCARTSYKSHATGKISTLEEDLALYDRLLERQPIHASPAEHQGKPDSKFCGIWMNKRRHGNLVGWQQYRKFLPGENMAPLPEKYKNMLSDLTWHDQDYDPWR